MPGTVCNLIPPQYMCYQWTGSNYDEVTAAVDAANSFNNQNWRTGQWSVRSADNALINGNGWGWAFLLNSWLISTPYYGTDSYNFYSGASWATGVTAAEFALQYKAV